MEKIITNRPSSSSRWSSLTLESRMCTACFGRRKDLLRGTGTALNISASVRAGWGILELLGPATDPYHLDVYLIYYVKNDEE